MLLDQDRKKKNNYKKKNAWIASGKDLDKNKKRKGEGNEQLGLASNVSIGSTDKDLDKRNKKSGKLGRGKKESGARGKSKFQEYLEMEMGREKVSAEEDLELERKLAKKLKVKGRKLGGVSDGMDFLTGESLDELDTFVGDEELEEVDEEREEDDVVVKKKRKRKEASVELSEGKIVGMESGEEGEIDNVSAKEIKGKRKRKRKEASAELAEGKIAGMESGEERKIDDVNTKEIKRKRKRKKSSVDSEKKSELELVDIVSQENDQPKEYTNGQSADVKPVVPSGVKYVAPHMWGSARTESEELSGIRRQVKSMISVLQE